MLVLNGKLKDCFIWTKELDLYAVREKKYLKVKF
jgi:hypothetical protein